MSDAFYENMEGNNRKILSVINQNNEDGEDLYKLELRSFKNLWLQDVLLEERSCLKDIDFITSDKCIVKAHRTILCIFSSMVRGMMENISCCQSIAILLPDCSSRSLIHVLNMISTGESLEDSSETLNELSETELSEVEDVANIIGIQISVVRSTAKWNSFGDSFSAATPVWFDNDEEVLDCEAVVNKVNDVLTNTDANDSIEIEPKERVIAAVKSKKLKQLQNLLESSKNQPFYDTLMDNAGDDDLKNKMVETSEVSVNLEIDIQGDQLVLGNVSNEEYNDMYTLENINDCFYFGDGQATSEPLEEDMETEKEYVNPMTIGEIKDEHVTKIDENLQTPGIQHVQMPELPENPMVLEDIETPELPQISPLYSSKINMGKEEFRPGDLVLVNFPGSGYWPCQITRVRSKNWRDVVYFGALEVGKAHVLVIRAYDQVVNNSLEKYIPKRKVAKNPMLRLAVHQINKKLSRMCSTTFSEDEGSSTNKLEVHHKK